MWFFEVESRRFLAVNRAAIQHYGYSEAEFLKMTTLDIRSESEKARQLRLPREEFPEPKSIGIWKHRTKDGTELDVEVILQDIPGEKSERRLAVLLDTTQKRKAEDALRSSEARFRSIFEQSLVGIYSSTAEGRLLECNEAFARMFGYASIAEISARKTTSLYLRPEDREAVMEVLKEKRQVRDLEIPFRHKNGSILWAFGSASLVESPEHGGQIIAGMLVDITARRKAEQALHESQLVLERAQDVARVGSWRWDMTKTPPRLEWSKHLYRLVGLPEDDERPTDELFTALTHPDDRKLLTDRRDAMFEGRTVEDAFRIRLKHAAGGFRWFRTRGQPRFDGEGRLVEVVGAAQDITDQIEAQELIQKSQTMLALGKLVAGVAHEVRNPLFAISGTIDAFEADFGDRSEFHEYAAVLRREIERLTVLMSDLLEYGRPVAAQSSPGSIGSVIERAVAVCSSLARERQVKIEIESSEEFPEIPMDATRLVQVFQNLIQNSLQHSPKGGSVVVRIGRGGDDPSDLVCTIEDAGTGIREQDLENVFEPFFTRRPGGTGLGLSIVERIVEAHGGRVAAANRPQGGAILTVRLPVDPRTPG